MNSAEKQAELNKLADQAVDKLFNDLEKKNNHKLAIEYIAFFCFLGVVFYCGYLLGASH